MRDLVLAAILGVFGFWLLAISDPMDANAGQFIVAWLSIALGVMFAAYAALERLP